MRSCSCARVCRNSVDYLTRGIKDNDHVDFFLWWKNYFQNEHSGVNLYEIILLLILRCDYVMNRDA